MGGEEEEEGVGMGGRTATPSPGRGWPCGRVARRLLALWKKIYLKAGIICGDEF